MVDAKGGQDFHELISGSEEYEVQYLSERLGVSREQVIEAIKVVGNERKKIEEYLTKI